MSTSRPITTTVAARIPYANTAPFYALWGDAPFAVRNLVPRDLGREAEAGTVDLGIMAAGDYLRLKPRFEMLAPLGVSAPFSRCCSSRAGQSPLSMARSSR